MSLDDAGEEACFLIRASSFPQAPFISPPPVAGHPRNIRRSNEKKFKKKQKKRNTLQRHLVKRALDSELRTRYQSFKKPVPLARQACNVIWTWPTKLVR